MADPGIPVMLEPDVPPAVPKAVRTALLLLAASALAGIARYLAVSYEAIHSSDRIDSTAITIVGLAVRVAIWLALINDAFKGRRISRFVLLALFASYVAEIVVMYNDLLVLPLQAVLALLQTGLLAVGVLRLYTRPARAWFNRHVTDYAPDVFPRYRRAVTTLATLGGAAVLGVMIWSMRDLVSLHLVQTHGPVSLLQARACPIPLPASVRNIQYCKYRHWVAFKDCVRFEAPVQDCIVHAKIVAAFCNARYSGPVQPSLGVLAAFPAAEPGRPDADLQAVWLVSEAHRYAPWFDLENIRNGLHGGEGGPSQAQIWIDLDRGVFYYAITD